jgi:asparagine synthetase B (glutamine-hydrolysing)
MPVFSFNQVILDIDFILDENLKGLTFEKDNSYFYFSGNPILKIDGSYTDYTHLINWENLKDVISNGQNNFVCFAFNKSTQEVFFSSSRYTRQRIFYIKENEKITLSTNLKDLIPHSNKKANLAAMYSVVKFGESPEFITVIDNINVLPVSCLVQCKIKDLFIQDIPKLSEQYFRVNYNFNGSSIENTEQKLENILGFLAQKDLLLPVSGGIDSTLINCIVNKYKIEQYPAYYIQFGSNDNEQFFAKEAIKNTKADLDICIMNADDLVDTFEYQAGILDSPIGEPSSIPLAFFFKQDKYKNYTVLDGTLADSCYGAKNYSQELFHGIKQRGKTSQVLNELVAGTLQKYNLKGQEKFYPRDAQIEDDFLKFLNTYIGPLSRVFFPKSNEYNKTIEPLWLWYYNLIDTSLLSKEDAEWAKYTIFRTIGYSSRVASTKTQDCSLNNYAEYPFIWKDILDDQAHYSWKEKTHNNIVKYPLKNILSKYKPHEFIFREKMGLNNQIPEWSLKKENRAYFTNFLSTNNSIVVQLIGERNLNQLIKNYNSNYVHPNVINLVISLCSLQKWCDANLIE